MFEALLYSKNSRHAKAKARKEKKATHPSILKVRRVWYVEGRGLPTEVLEICSWISERLARLGDAIYFV
jgi:hypothetical protein